MLEHLTNNGKAGIIVPEGIIFQGGNAYKQLRRLLVEDNYLVGVISLPAGVFNPYSGVKTSILWIDKALAKKTDKIIFLKVNNDGFDLGAQRKPIEANDLPAAFANAMAYKNAILTQSEYVAPDKDVILVEKGKLAENGDYNLSGERYVISGKTTTDYPLINLFEVAEVISGQSPEGLYYNSEGKGLPFYQGKTEFTEMYLGNPTKWTTQVTKKAIPSDIVMSVRAPVGPVNIVMSEICIGRGLAAIRCSDKINYLFCFYILRSMENQITGNAGSTFASINKSDICKLKIPLPPLSVQEEIVAELDSYQKIIDGAKQVVDNWKPHIDIDPSWDIVKLKEICSFEYGKGLPENDRKPGPYPVLGSNGIAGYHNNSFVKGPVIVIGRKGSAGEVVWEDRDCCPIDTTFYVKHDESKIEYKYLYYVLKMLNLQKLRGGTGIPGLNRNDAYDLLIHLPNLSTQHDILQRINKEEEMINATRELISLYNQKIHDRIQSLWNS